MRNYTKQCKLALILKWEKIAYLSSFQLPITQELLFIQYSTPLMTYPHIRTKLCLIILRLYYKIRTKMMLGLQSATKTDYKVRQLQRLQSTSELDYKLQQVLDYKMRQKFKKSITKCDGITKHDGLQSDTVQASRFSLAVIITTTSLPSWFFVDIFFQCAKFLTNYILELCIQLLFYKAFHLHEDGFSNFSLSFYFPLKHQSIKPKEYRRQKFYINIYLFLQKWRISFETLFYDMVHFANLLLFSQPECNLDLNNLPQ